MKQTSRLAPKRMSLLALTQEAAGARVAHLTARRPRRVRALPQAAVAIKWAFRI